MSRIREVEDTVAHIYPLLPIAAGLVMIGFPLRRLGLSAFLARRGIRTQGEIIGYRETATSASMIVRFTTVEGREVHAAHENTGWTASRSDDIVTVSYDPESPERARVVAAPWLSNCVPIMVGGLGFSLVAIGLVLSWAAWGPSPSAAGVG